MTRWFYLSTGLTAVENGAVDVGEEALRYRGGGPK